MKTTKTAVKLSLDVDAPDKVASVLREAAQAYFYSACELSSAWQDGRAGEPWQVIGDALITAANRIDRNLA